MTLCKYHERFDLLEFANVAGNCPSLATVLPDLFYGLQSRRQIDISAKNLAIAASYFKRKRSADAAPGAGDDSTSSLRDFSHMQLKATRWEKQ